MTAIISAIVGFLGSILPRFLDLYREGMDMKHELALLDKQIEAQRLLGTQEVQAVAIEADAKTQEAIYKTYQSGVYWVDALNGTVRPVIAYSFFLAYIMVKVMTYLSIPADAPDLYILEALWNENDMAIFSGVIAFYYGNRVFDKVARWK